MCIFRLAAIKLHVESARRAARARSLQVTGIWSTSTQSAIQQLIRRPTAMLAPLAVGRAACSRGFTQSRRSFSLPRTRALSSSTTCASSQMFAACEFEVFGIGNRPTRRQGCPPPPPPPSALTARTHRLRPCTAATPQAFLSHAAHAVQGVFFRAHTVDKARQLGLVGYVMNTARGSVKGEVQGAPPAVNEMRGWLRTTGSPHSVIERAEFGEDRQLEALEYDTFSTRRR